MGKLLKERMEERLEAKAKQTGTGRPGVPALAGQGGPGIVSTF
ncbi:hypothetical protein [Desulfofundulus sp. TPOSR]|nr:hypothetical protein [Desulfofundulus sp. TPOSR]